MVKINDSKLVEESEKELDDYEKSEEEELDYFEESLEELPKRFGAPDLPRHGTKYCMALLKQNVDQKTITQTKRVTPIDLDKIDDEHTRDYYRDLLVQCMQSVNTTHLIRSHYLYVDDRLDALVKKRKRDLSTLPQKVPKIHEEVTVELS